MKKRAFLFDLDGTLLDTAPDLYLAINALRNEFGLTPLAFDTALAMVGKGAHNLVQRALTHQTSIDFNLDEAYQHFAQHYHRVNGQDTRAYDDVDQTLRGLHAAGHPLAIVTNKPSEFTLPLIQQFAWNDLFDSIVCGDTLTVKKPNPEPILYACTQLKCAPDHALMVGDSMNDVIAAQGAHCDCVILDYGYNEGVPIRDALAGSDIPISHSFKFILSFATKMTHIENNAI